MDKERLLRYKEKLEYLEKTLGNLKEWTHDIDEQYFVNRLDLQKKYGIYHAFQIAVEITSDLSAMLIKDNKIIPKDDYSNIDTLSEKAIISSVVGAHLKEANGLRNRIVHEYNGLNDLIVYQRVLELIKSFNKFKEVVNQWLKKNS